MRGALFFSLKDNVSYEETGTKYKRDREYAGLWAVSYTHLGGAYTEDGVFVGILCGGDEEGKVAVVPYSMIETERP